MTATNKLREKMREIFEMVYQWGRVGIVVDDSAHAYQDMMKALIHDEVMKERKRCVEVVENVNLAPSQHDTDILRSMKTSFEGFGYGRVWFLKEAKARLLGLESEGKND